MRLVIVEARRDLIREAAFDEAKRVAGVRSGELLPSTKLAVEAAVEAAIDKMCELMA